MTKYNRAPSTGEVSAITGYLKQYEYSAAVLLRLMQDDSFEAISVSEPSAGIFDDLVMHTLGQVVATQVKSERDATYVSLKTEFKGLLITSMAESWLSLQKRFNTDAVRLRYIFPGLFSKSDTALANKGTSGARHSAEFARFVSRDDLTLEIVKASVWENTLNELQSRSSLDEATFIRFLRDLTLKDERELQANSIAAFQPSEGEKVEAICNLLPDLIKTSSPGQKWSEQDLIDKLGWRSRLSQHNSHVFPVPSDYQENEATERKLLDLINQTTQGYIALVGPPGTGKSTLLQRALHSTPEFSVSRYLAFLPGQRYGLGRAEAGEFLNDLISELRSQGLHASKFSPDMLSGLRTEFTRQMDAASERYHKSGRKTLIVIDGLDHVPREETPKASFLSELPASAVIPEGVVFLLGTQRMDLPGLQPTIIQQTEGSNRTVTIDPLTKAAVFELADAAGLPNCVNREALFIGCDGHPLSARYFIEALKHVSEENEAAKILSDTEGLGQSLQQMYERVWLKLAATPSALAALGLLARAEGTLSCEQLSAGSRDEAVEEVLANAGFLLKRNGDDRLSIYHNSFRLYIAHETGTKFGKPNAELEADFNTRLAMIAQKVDRDDPQHWFQLRYLARAQDFDGVRALGNPSYFRESLKALRPSDEVYTDLRLTYGAVRPTRDRTLLLNKLLIEKEVDYRLEAVSELDTVDLLMELGDFELAARHALENGGSGQGWLALVDYYWDNGETERSRQLFEANEPLDVFFSEDGFDPYQNMDLAEGWIQRAQRFRSNEKLLALIASLVMQNPRARKRDDDDDGSWVSGRLKYHLALGMIEDGRSTDLKAIEQEIGLTEEEAATLAVRTAELMQSAGRIKKAVAFVKRANSVGALLEAHPSWRRSAAFIAHKVGETKLARQLAETLTIPRLDRSSTRGDTANLSRIIIETEFLSRILNVEIAEEALEERREPSALLASAHVKTRELGALRSQAKKQDPGLTANALRTIVLFFSAAKPDRGDFDGHRFFSSFGDIARHIVQIAQDTGEQCFADIVALVDELILKDDSNFSVSDKFRLRFATAVFDKNQNAQSAAVRIAAVLAEDRSYHTPHEAVEAYSAIAHAYCHIGQTSKARACLDAMHKETFGYWLRAKKEPQYEFWAWSFLKACEDSPNTMENGALVFARFILGMGETEGAGTAARLYADLLEGSGVSPRAAAGITVRLLDSDLGTWANISEAALASVVKQDDSLAPLVLIACSCLVVPFANGGIDRCLRACIPVMSAAKRAYPLEVLISSIRRWCPPSEREDILRTVIDLAPETEESLRPLIAEAATMADKLRQVTNGEPRNSSTQNETSFDIEAGSLAELVEYGNGESDYGDRVDYSYARSAEKLVPTATKDEISDFLAQRPHVEADAKTMVAVARRLLALGFRAEALEFFSKAESAAFSGHWSSFLGGQKLAVQKLRVDLNGPSALDTGFDVLMGELANGQTNGSSLFLNLDDVLELITDPIPAADFWAETQEHLMQYREFGLADPVQPIDTVCSNTDLLAFIVAQGFGLSCPEVLKHARRAGELIACASSDSIFVEKLIQFMRKLPNGGRESAALMDRLRKEPHLQVLLLSDAKNEATNDDFIVSNIAKRALHDMGEPFVEPESMSLPTFYKLHLPDSDQADNFDPPPGLLSGQRPLWSDDPWTWTTMLRGSLRLMADASNLPLEMLRRRCAEFMKKEGGRAAFGPEIEDAILQKLRRLHLPFAYRRPMASSCLRALGKVLQELDVAGAIDPRVFHVLWADMGGPSLSDFSIEEVPRPDWLSWPSMPRREYGGIDADKWLEQAETMLNSTLAPGAFVLAQEAHFAVQASRLSAEATKVSLPSSAELIKGIEGLPKLFALDYLRPMYERGDSKLVCRIPGDFFGNLENDTLTICPYAADDLGWRRTDSNLLELRDSSNELVAQTIRWVEGTYGHQPLYEAEVYGAGQIVLLTKIGKAQLAASGMVLTIGTKVTAMHKGEGGELKSRVFLAEG